MALRSKSAGMRRLIKKRDNAFDQLTFNQKYPAVLKAAQEENVRRRLRELENKSKKRLLPLEVAAAPPSQANKWLLETRLAKFQEKQAFKRLAIEQAYLRAVKKSGQEQARADYQKKLAALEDDLARYRRKLEQKYPQGGNAPADPAAIARYRAAEQKEAEKLAAAKARLLAQQQKEWNKITAKLERKNQKLRSTFEEANNQLKALSKIDPETFGRDTLLKIQNVKMYFSGIKAVDDISFDIKEGEIFGLIGPNGAGKTTLFNCITQFYKPTAGNVYYRDRFGNIVDLTDYKTHDVIKTGIARTFQNLELVMDLSVLDNLLVGAHSFYRASLFDQFLHTKKLKREEEYQRAQALEILERLNLLAYKDFFPKGLPYGILKKVELARTLMTKPRLIILDEPAAGLNEAETEELIDIIRRIRDDFHCTIFLVEHDMNLVMNLCDTVCATSFGKLLAKGTPEEIQANPLVQEAYLGGKEDAV